MRPLILALCLIATPALSHSWYDGDCCSDKDCAPISPQHITITNDGYLVTLKPGDHPTVIRPVTRFFAYDDKDVRPSMDGEWHVCVAPWFENYMGHVNGPQYDNSEPLCIYVPGVGA